MPTVSRAYVIHCPPLFPPGLLACPPSASPKIIPWISREDTSSQVPTAPSQSILAANATKRTPPRAQRCDRIPNSAIGSSRERIMADASAQYPAPSPATVADVMHPPVTTVVQNDHVAAAAYLMNRAHATTLIVTQAQTRKPFALNPRPPISHATPPPPTPTPAPLYHLL